MRLGKQPLFKQDFRFNGVVDILADRVEAVQFCEIVEIGILVGAVFVKFRYSDQCPRFPRRRQCLDDFGVALGAPVIIGADNQFRSDKVLAPFVGYAAGCCRLRVVMPD